MQRVMAHFSVTLCFNRGYLLCNKYINYILFFTCTTAGGGSILALHPTALGLIASVLKNFSLDVAEIYCQHCSEQWTGA